MVLFKIKFLKDTELKKAGEIGEATKVNAEAFVNSGYAEYISEPNIKKKAIRKGSEADGKRIREKLDKLLAGELPSEEKPQIIKDLEENREKIEKKKIVIELIEQVNEKELIEQAEEKEKTAQDGEFILDESKLPQIIDHAMGNITIENKSYRYYGVKIYQKKKKKVKVKKEFMTILVTEKENALVLENGEIISLYDKPNLFIFDSIMSTKTNRWSLKSINSFKEKSFIKNDFTYKKVFDAYKKIYEDSMVFDEPMWYNLNAIFDMASYYWDLIDKFIIPKHEGISGSAKSKAMKISANLSFNGKKFLCPNPANFFRYRHNNKATICIEEAERLFGDSKHSSDDSLLVEYLNGGYEKGNIVPRQNDKDVNQMDEFDPAGFTRIGSIKPLKGALAKRSITLSMIKASKNDKRGNVEVPTEIDKDYQKARDMSYICGLINYNMFKEALKDVKNEYNLVNRQWLVAKPLIAMAKCVDLSDKLSEKLSDDKTPFSDKLTNLTTFRGVGMEKKIGDFFAKLFEIRDEVIDESNWERVLGRCLIELSIKDNKSFISNDEINNIFQNKLPFATLTTQGINTTLTKMGFSKFYGRDTKGDQRGYTINLYEICDILLRQEYFHIDDIVKIVEKLSELSELSDSIAKIKNWYSDNYLTNPKKDCQTAKNIKNNPKLTKPIIQECVSCGEKSLREKMDKKGNKWFCTKCIMNGDTF